MPTDPVPEVSSLLGADELVELYERHARRLHRYVARRVGVEIADDLVADAFVALWEQRDRFEPSRAGLKTWLYAIATNLMRKHARGEVRRLQAWARDHGRRLVADDLGDRIVASVDAGALAGELAGAIASLRDEERDVLLLVAWADLTPTEAAEVLGLAVGTVRTRLHRARSRVREQMTKDHRRKERGHASH